MMAEIKKLSLIIAVVLVFGMNAGADDTMLKLGKQLKSIVKQAKSGEASPKTVSDLKAITADKGNNIVLRGYAAWAVGQLFPCPVDKPGQIYHVAQKHPAASDNNPGTQKLPWKTIQRAAETLRAGDSVLIYTGVYRESVRPFFSGTGKKRMITYKAAPGNKPVLKGSDIWQPDWRAEANGLWSASYKRHEWDHPEKWPRPRQGAMHRAEQVFVDGKLLVHVDTVKKLKAQSESFFTDDKTGRLWINLKDAAPPAKRFIERSMRQQVFAPAVRGLGYIKVKGLKMLHGAAPESNGANWRKIGHRSVMSVRAGHNWIIEDNTIEWGNAQGLDLGREGWGPPFTAQPIVSNKKGYHQVFRNRVNYHGVAGIVGWAHGTNNLLLEDNETNFNCQKGNYSQYEAGGVKLHYAKDCIIRRHRSHANNASGIWLDYRCLRNRVTQCILTENKHKGFFFEVSAGPLLVDNNVILNTRDIGDGLYSHDGNNATYINNYIQGGRGYGVHIRNMFKRISQGKYTTTNHNRVRNNFLFDNQMGGISFNPDVPRAEDNCSDNNIFQNKGGAPQMRLSSGFPVVWRKTSAGKKIALSGIGGERKLGFQDWVKGTRNDANSMIFPRELLFPDSDPKKIRDRLISVWPADYPALDSAYAPLPDNKRFTAANQVANLVPQLNACKLLCSIELGPGSYTQIWKNEGKTSSRPQGLIVSWIGKCKGKITPLRGNMSALLNEPVKNSDEQAELFTRENLSFPIKPGTQIAFSALSAKIKGGFLKVSAGIKDKVGKYNIVLIEKDKWKLMPLRILQRYDVLKIAPSAKGGKHLNISIINNSKKAAEAQVFVNLDKIKISTSTLLAARKTTLVKVPIPKTFDNFGVAKVQVDVKGMKRLASGIVAFIAAQKTDNWKRTKLYDFSDFPGGVFPEGAEATLLYVSGLKAAWRARYDKNNLYLRFEVLDPLHIQNAHMSYLYRQDSVQILLCGNKKKGFLELSLALPSKSGAKAVAYCYKTPAPEQSPIGLQQTPAFPLNIRREGLKTLYDLTVSWKMLGMEKSFRTGSVLEFSSLVNTGGPTQRHGLQWFFGIHTSRGDQSTVGKLLLD